MKLGTVAAIAVSSALALSGCSPVTLATPAPGASVTVPPASPAATVTPTSPAATTSAAASPPVTPSPATPTPTPTQPAEIEIDSVWNFRDVAGSDAGLPLADGGHMARGVVYRSGKLKGISAADKRTLIKAGVTDIFDLRTDQAAARAPDPVIGDATYHLVNIFAVYSYSSPTGATVEETMEQRAELNRRFVSSAKQRKRIGELLEAIAEAEGAAIIHCAEGKDRTGWVAAVLQLIAGVDEATIMDEYLLSNEYRAEAIEADLAKVRKSKGKKAAELRRAKITVHEQYLQAGLDEMTTRYGDLEGYLTDGLGLSEDTIEALRDKLVLQ